MKNIIITLAVIAIILFFGFSKNIITDDAEQPTTKKEILTPINTILKQPQIFHKKEIIIGGIVGDKSFGIAGYGLYQLQDKTGSIMVFTSNGIPAKGKAIHQLKGTVNQALSFGDKTFLVIEESDPPPRNHFPLPQQKNKG